MSAGPIASVVISTAEDLERIELEIRTAEFDELELEILDGSTALLAVGDVRRLLAAARDSGTRLTFVTDDPLRRELISILGGEVRPSQPTSAPESTSSLSSSSDDLTRRIGYLPEPIRQSVTTSVDRSILPSRDEPSFSFVITPPSSRHRHDSTSNWQAERESALAAPSQRKHRKRRGWARVAIGLGTTLTLALVAALLALYLMPSATIVVTPLVTDVSVEVTYGVAAPGTNWDIPVLPTALDATVTTSASIATTGERFEPDGTAEGLLRLTNASTSEVLVPAGTELASGAGIAFVTVEDVVVPAADPFGSLTFGNASVGIQAVSAGPAGNLASESIVGQLDSGIFFANIEPTLGGSTRRVPTVSQADLDALKARATAELNDRAPAELAAGLASGQLLLAGSEERSEITFALDHALGSDAAEVRVDATLRVSALAYSLDDVHAVARDEAAQSLATLAGPDAVVLPDSVTLSDPEPIAEASSPAFRVRASGQAQAIIDEAAIEQLPRRTTDAGVDDAREIAAEIPGVSQVVIESSPDWLPFGMPRRASRIEVVVAGGAADGPSAPNGATSGP